MGLRCSTPRCAVPSSSNGTFWTSSRFRLSAQATAHWPSRRSSSPERARLDDRRCRTDDRVVRDDLPTGTVTFLFTDVEGSTRLLHEHGAGVRRPARRAPAGRSGTRSAAHDGVEVDTQGDAFFVAFRASGRRRRCRRRGTARARKRPDPGPHGHPHGRADRDGRGLRRHRRPPRGADRRGRPRRTDRPLRDHPRTPRERRRHS